MLLALILIFRPNGIAGGKELALIRHAEPQPGNPTTLRSDPNAVA